MGQAADDQPQGTQRLVDLDALLELLSHSTRCLLILTAYMVSTCFLRTNTSSNCVGCCMCAYACLSRPCSETWMPAIAGVGFEALLCFDRRLAASCHTLQSNAAE